MALLLDIEFSRKYGFGKRFLGKIPRKSPFPAQIGENYVEFGDFRLDLGRNWEGFGELEATKERLSMRKKGYKGRCEKRVLNKCQDVCRTYDDIQRAYTDVLQEREEVVEFRCNIPLDGLEEGEFTTDFLVTRTDGDIFIRECVQRKFLTKPMTVKLLDASREYWLKRGVTDWGLVIDAEA